MRLDPPSFDSPGPRHAADRDSDGANDLLGAASSDGDSSPTLNVRIEASEDIVDGSIDEGRDVGASGHDARAGDGAGIHLLLAGNVELDGDAKPRATLGLLEKCVERLLVPVRAFQRTHRPNKRDVTSPARSVDRLPDELLEDRGGEGDFRSLRQRGGRSDFD